MTGFEFDLNTGVGTLRFDNDKPIGPQKIREAIRSAGFETVWIDLSVTGRLIMASASGGEEMLALDIVSPKQRVFLAPGKEEESKRAYYDASKWAGSGKMVWIRGRLHEHPGTDLGLVIREYRVRK